jgi:DNA-binding NarL/FixJ family response regulator
MQITYEQVLILLNPGRERENLVVLLESFLPAEIIQVAECPSKGLEYLKASGNGLVFIDLNCLKEELVETLNEIHWRNPLSRVLLLLSYPHEIDPFLEIRTDGILYDGFSTRTLVDMLGQFTSPT